MGLIKMGSCGCGYSTQYPACNGTHKVVKKVREDIANAIKNYSDTFTDETTKQIILDASNIARNYK